MGYNNYYLTTRKYHKTIFNESFNSMKRSNLRHPRYRISDILPIKLSSLLTRDGN